MTDQPTGLALIDANPGVVLLDKERFNQFYEQVKAETDKVGADVSTAKNRDAIKSMAFKVVKSKTAIDNAGKLLKEEAQATVQKVDAARREIRAKLEELAIEVRAPLTKWEEQQEARVALCREVCENLKQDALILVDEDSETVGARLERVKAMELKEEDFPVLWDSANHFRDLAIEALTNGHARLLKEEADRAELEALRKQAAEREEQDRLRQEAEDAERRRAERVEQIMDHITEVGNGMIGGSRHPYVILLRELEEKVVADETYGTDQAKVEAHRVATLAKVHEAMEADRVRDAAEAEEAEKKRIADAAAAAKEEARIAAEKSAEEARVAQQRAHDEAIAAEKRRADEAEAAQRQQAEQASAAQEAKAAEEKRVQDAADARAADQAHRSKIMGAAKQAIIAHGVGEATAKAIVLAIAAGDVPAVTITF